MRRLREHPFDGELRHASKDGPRLESEEAPGEEAVFSLSSGWARGTELHHQSLLHRLSQGPPLHSLQENLPNPSAAFVSKSVIIPASVETYHSAGITAATNNIKHLEQRGDVVTRSNHHQ